MTDDDIIENLVLDPLSKSGRCGIFTNANGQILIIHSDELESSIQWLEYDKADNTLFVIHENGGTQDLGLAIDPKAQSNILQAAEVTMAHFANKKIQSSQTITLIIREY